MQHEYICILIHGPLVSICIHDVTVGSTVTQESEKSAPPPPPSAPALAHAIDIVSAAAEASGNKQRASESGRGDNDLASQLKCFPPSPRPIRHFHRSV